MIRLLQLLLIFTVCSFTIPNSMACSCSYNGVSTISEIVDGYEYVFKGQTLKVEAGEKGIYSSRRIATFIPVKIFKGPFTDEIKIEYFDHDASNFACHSESYDIGQQYYIFASRDESGELRPAIWCSPAKQYGFLDTHIEDFFGQGKNTLLLGEGCKLKLRRHIDAETFLGRAEEYDLNDVCLEQLDTFRAWLKSQKSVE